MAKVERGRVGNVDFRVRRAKGLWHAEILASDGKGWQLAVTPSANMEQQLDAAIIAARYANAKSEAQWGRIAK